MWFGGDSETIGSRIRDESDKNIKRNVENAVMTNSDVFDDYDAGKNRCCLCQVRRTYNELGLGLD